MQKIMFEHSRFGLEQAVIARLKEMTRRQVRFPKGTNDADVETAVMGIDEKGRVYFTFSTGKESFDIYPKYQIGEKVAIAQSYEKILSNHGLPRQENPIDQEYPDGLHDAYRNPIVIRAMMDNNAYRNKMFVRADLMPYVIEITDIKAERLQDISDEDCLREGIIHVVWRQFPEPNNDHYIDRDLWTLPKYRGQFEDPWDDRDPDVWAAESPRTAFAALIIQMQGKKVWERNGWQFAYTFKLVK